MQRARLLDLLEYHYWARDRILDAATVLPLEQLTRDLGSSHRSIRDTLVHTYSAEWVWHARWSGRPPVAMLDPSEYSDIETLGSAWRAHEVNVRAVLSGTDDSGFQRVIEYKTLAGGSVASVFWQMVQHMVNHGSYHRGQVTTMLRQLGAQPPKTMDLIAFYRERGS